MSFFTRTKQDTDARDETIARQAIEIGNLRAQHAETHAQVQLGRKVVA